MFGLTNPEVALLMMGIFLFLVLLGFPIAFTLLAMGVGFGYFAYYNPETMNTIFDNRVFDKSFQRMKVEATLCSWRIKTDLILGS